MANTAIGFTNAFYRYVDAVKALNNPVLEQKKLDRAVELLTELVSMYQLNANKCTFTAPSVGVGISSAASTMNTNCRAKLLRVGAKVSSNVMEANQSQNKANSSTKGGLIALVIIGVIVFILWMGWGLFW